MNDIALVLAYIRNWWYNLHLDNQGVLIAIVLAGIVAAFVARIIKPPKT